MAMDRKDPQAMEAYEAALAADPGMAECHYNLARPKTNGRRPGRIEASR